MVSVLLRCLLGIGCAAAAPWALAVEIVVATVNNAHMIRLQQLTPHFERAHPDVRVRWVVLDEALLRQRVAADVVRAGGEFDVVTLGMVETQVWGREGRLLPLSLPPDYEPDDLLPPVRNGLAIDGRAYGVPFYGESSMLYYRRDLLDQAGLTLPERPTWRQVRDAAARLHDPRNGVYGICLRGKAGWGDNMALLLSMVQAHGGQWFGADYRPQIDSKPWREAVGLYLELLQRWGPPGSAANSYNELLALYSQGRCALWVDATIAASSLSDPATSRVAGRVGVTQAPSAGSARGANWLWVWALAVPAASRHEAEAQRFVAWATSREYVALAAQELGWGAVPTGVRRSTYEQPGFARAATFAAAERRALDSGRNNYLVAQTTAIPEFQTVGIAVGQQISAALQGRIGLDQALKAAQAAADREMRRAGYY